MIKCIESYECIYKLSECIFEDGALNEIIEKVKGFIKDCDLNCKNLYVDTTLDFHIEFYYFDGIFLNIINPLMLNKEEKCKPTKRVSKDENGEFIIETSNEFIDMTLYDYYKDWFLLERQKYMQNYEDGRIKYNRLHDKFRPLMFGIFYKNMNDEQKYNNFISTYKYVDFAGQTFTIDDYKNIAEIVPKSILSKRMSYDDIVEEGGFVTVFRGEERESSREIYAVSWTTDIEVAEFFASRFDEEGSEGRVLTGKVHIDDIIVIYDKEFYDDEEDPEKEILVKPNSVKEIRIIN